MSRRRIERDRAVQERRDELAAEWRRLRGGAESETGLSVRGWPLALMVIAAGAGLALALARKRA